ncbi:MAG: metallopeptidase family protein [Alphaproteobacteria bacterium]
MARVYRADKFGTAPDLDDLAAIGDAALGTLPGRLRQHMKGVVLRVEDFPDDETCAEMDLESPFDLLGLYRGVAMTEKSGFDLPGEPDMVFLYRRPILDYWCDSGEDLERLVRHVLIHEIGHHFGFSDSDMETLEAQA